MALSISTIGAFEVFFFLFRTFLLDRFTDPLLGLFFVFPMTREAFFYVGGGDEGTLALAESEDDEGVVTFSLPFPFDRAMTKSGSVRQ